MGVGVREGAKAIVIFLTGGIPQGEFDVLSVHLYIGHVVLKNSGDIDLQDIDYQYEKRKNQRKKFFTSGNVPFENTLSRESRVSLSREKKIEHLHKKTSLPASTVTDNNQLAPDLSHRFLTRAHYD